MRRTNRLLFFHFILSILCHDTDRTEITASNNSYMVTYVFVAAETCLRSRSLTTAVSSDCTVDRENTQTYRSPKSPFISFSNKGGIVKKEQTKISRYSDKSKAAPLRRRRSIPGRVKRYFSPP